MRISINYDDCCFIAIWLLKCNCSCLACAFTKAHIFRTGTERSWKAVHHPKTNLIATEGSEEQPQNEFPRNGPCQQCSWPFSPGSWWCPCQRPAKHVGMCQTLGSNQRIQRLVNCGSRNVDSDSDIIHQAWSNHSLGEDPCPLVWQLQSFTELN
jgi:hypothetical protein